MNQRYTIQPVGRGGKLLAHDWSGTTTAITTVPDLAVGEQAAGMLRFEHDYGCSFLAGDADRAGTGPANCRRRMLTAFDAACATGEAPEADAALWVAERFGARLGAVLHGQPPAVVAAIRGEAAKLYTGYDDILVTATVSSSEYKGGQERVVVNAWLPDDGDDRDTEGLEALSEALAGDGHVYGPAAYGLVDLFSSDLQGLDGDPVDHEVVLDLTALRAWCAEHRPALLP